MNVSILEKILTSKHEYWLINKVNERTGGINPQKFKPSIMMVVIPYSISKSEKREDIKLVDLEKLEKVYLDGNIHLNEDYAPFQSTQDLYNVNQAYPIPCKQKQFLIKALDLVSDKIWDYKEIIDELCSNKA